MTWLFSNTKKKQISLQRYGSGTSVKRNIIRSRPSLPERACKRLSQFESSRTELTEHCADGELLAEQVEHLAKIYEIETTQHHSEDWILKHGAASLAGRLSPRTFL